MNHQCDPTVPVCSCGYRWAYMSKWSDGKITYSSEIVRSKYEAIYGEKAIGESQFSPVEEKR